MDQSDAEEIIIQLRALNDKMERIVNALEGRLPPLAEPLDNHDLALIKRYVDALKD